LVYFLGFFMANEKPKSDVPKKTYQAYAACLAPLVTEAIEATNLIRKVAPPIGAAGLISKPDENPAFRAPYGDKDVITQFDPRGRPVVSVKDTVGKYTAGASLDGLASQKSPEAKNDLLIAATIGQNIPWYKCLDKKPATKPQAPSPGRH
jgi:hypothetical protein